jgi:hypothetical protein
VNESIRFRELKMTLICKTCTHQYGAWRPRCPACGTSTPVSQQQPASFNPPRPTKARSEKSKTECIACRHRGAKERCPHCNELIHTTCLTVHVDDCKQFQVEREAMLKQVNA